MNAALAAILSRPRAVLSMMIVMLLAGVWSFVEIPKEADPDIQIPVVYISVPLPGISPEDSERLLVKPVEEKLRGLDGVKEMTGIASESHAGILVQFETEVDIDQAILDVREKVDLAKSELPTDAEEPTINEINFSLQPTIIVSLSGTVPERTLFKHARELQDALESINTVLEAKLSGQREELLEIIVDPVKLEAYGVTQQGLLNSASLNNRLVAAGAVNSSAGKFNVKIPGLFENASDIFNLVVRSSNGTTVTLGEVAEIKRTFKDRDRYAEFNGNPAIAIEVVKRLGSNILVNNNEVKRIIAEVTADWPQAIKVATTLDQSRLIADILGSLSSSIFLAILLVMTLVVAALGLRSGLMVGLAIPTSFMIGFLFFGFLGYTVNIMLMFGLVLTVGMLVDGSIVMIEYADRKMAEGLPKQEAYKAAAQRMFWPIVSSTATTLAAFLPMLLWPGVAGEFMGYLPLTVIVVLSASLITAMIFLPAVGTIFGKAGTTDKKNAARLAGDGEGDLLTMPGLTGKYIRFLNGAMKHPAKVLVVILLAMGGIVGAYAAKPTGVEFFVETEPEVAIVYVRARGNLSNEQKLTIVRKAYNKLAGHPAIDNLTTYAGTETGGDSGLGASQDVPADVVGQVQIELKPVGQRDNWVSVKKEFTAAVQGIPGTIIEVRELVGGPQSGKDIRLQVQSENREDAAKAVKKIRAHMENTMTGLIDVDDDLPLPGYEVQLKVDREEAGRFGASVAAAGSLVQLITNGALIGTYRPDDSRDELDIRVRLPENQRSLASLDTLKLQTPAGQQPLSNFVTREIKQQVNTLYRFNSKPSLFVKANAGPGVLANDKINELDTWLKQQTWEKGVSFKFRGADEDQQKSAAFLQKALLGSLFMMFMILVVQFNSFYHTALTLITVIMSAVGVILGMLVMRHYFSIIMTGTGLVALAGVVVNNAIVLIDTYQSMLKRGMNVKDATLRAAAQRIRPILLTTVTTILGLLPLMFQLNVNFVERTVTIGSMTSSWWVHMSTAMVFGLAFSTVLTLVFAPVMLSAPTVWKESWQRLRNRVSGKGDDASATTQPKAGKKDKPADDVPEAFPQAAE
ncbi:MAG: efflux RND transporter permease subunit [Anderseniella sp.]